MRPEFVPRPSDHLIGVIDRQETAAVLVRELDEAVHREDEGAVGTRLDNPATEIVAVPVRVICRIATGHFNSIMGGPSPRDKPECVGTALLAR